ncbi:MAG: imidazole glycerol phosphate synthase subunit HisH [Candidatus Eremiobacteraeota bacterium]|nr:imidazole glycerol phosphate synthase subunit HisH [Candidatus Eremiobacteraeota bacterium]
MLAVIDYGGGNLGSLCSALERRGARFTLTDDADAVAAADAAILPGDGAFGATMRALEGRGLGDAIRAVIGAGKPFLGICVGMQLLYERSDEHGEHRGFGAFAGSIERFRRAPRVPHMGWNELERVGEHPFTKGLENGAYAYFLHGYRAEIGVETVAASEHGERFTAIAARGNVMGTQFHPEKSQSTGALLLDNFLRIAAA